jgi:beta-lactam-binding protein with PASTA domain
MTGEQIKQLRDAICSAFDHDALEQSVRFHLEQRLDEIVPTDGGMDIIAFKLIEWTERKGNTRTLVWGIHQDAPNNEAVNAFCKQCAPYAFDPTTPPLTEVTTENPKPPAIISQDPSGGAGNKLPSSDDNSRKKRVLFAIAAVMLCSAIAFYFLPSLLHKKIIVPNVVGQTLERADEDLQARGLKAATLPSTREGNAPVGTVVRQIPDANQQIEPGGEVQLILQSEAPIKLASYIGRPKSDAETLLTALNLNFTEESTTSGSGLPGTVVSQNPDGGDVAPGSNIVLIVKVPPAAVSMPDIVGKRWLPDAKNLLDSVHISFNVVPTITRQYVAGQVSSASVANSNPVPTGRPVIVYVEGVPVPNTIGMDVNSAEVTLRRAGLRCIIPGYQPAPGVAKPVLTSSPPPGATALQSGVVILSVDPIYLRNPVILPPKVPPR